MTRVLLALLALAMSLNLAACSGAGFAQPAPSYDRPAWGSSGLAGGGG